jgi:E3 ubiquitin-protein ligase DOA10
VLKKPNEEKKKEAELEKSNIGTKRPLTPLICRICLCDDEVLNDNPLVSVCKCAGTMSMIHVKCINEWLNIKRETRVSTTTHSYQWTVLECELC